MDQLKIILEQELSNASELYSLQLQNHIYGCFIIMEDIAENKWNLNGTKLIKNDYEFNIDTQFNQIGIRYGFLMDTKLIHEFPSHYKELWLNIIQDSTLSFETIDLIEDIIIDIIKQLPSEVTYLINALDTGSLSHDWIDKVILLLHTNYSNITLDVNQINNTVLEQSIEPFKIIIKKHNFNHTKKTQSKISRSHTRRSHN